ncbi:hypothetical protein ES703_70810 [subsurface metagenome]
MLLYCDKMPDEIYAECSCISGQMKWELTGVLNTAELLTKKNLADIKEELRGIPHAKMAEHKKMALHKLEADLKAINELETEIGKIPVCPS